MSDVQVSEFTDAAAQQSLRRAMRLGLTVAAIALPIFWWKTGWQGAAEFAVGAAISLSGLWEWRRLMTALMERMDADAEASRTNVKPRAMGPVLVGFFIRLGVAVSVLYGSLKYINGPIDNINGPVIAVLCGLAIGIAALTIESLQLLKSWTE